MCTSVQCSRGKILVRYLYQKQSSKDQMREKLGAVNCNPRSSTVEPLFYDHPQNQIGVVVKEGVVVHEGF